MAGFWPLVVNAGQQEQLGPDRRAEIQRLNLGQFEPIVSPSNGFTVSQTVVAIFGGTNPIINTIAGGLQGDILVIILASGSLRLRSNVSQDGLRLKSNFNMNSFDSITFYHGGLTWVEIGRVS